MIIIVFGLPGSGKSFFASKLANKIKAKYLNSDTIRRQLFAVREYNSEEKMLVYNEMIKELKKLMKQDKSVVLDATFFKESIRNKFIKIVSDFGQNIIFIEVHADQKIIKERLSKRRENSEADYSIYLKIKKIFEPMDGEHLILESTQNNIDSMLDMAIKNL